MPFVSQKDTRAIQQQFGKYEHINEPSFGEVFDASVGQVFDEELSISSMLNREGFDRRNQLIDEKVQSGEIDGEKYKIRTTGRPGQATSSRLDYARIAKDHESEDIRTDEVLTQERNELLKSRRDYAQDVMERGSGLAQFTGGLTAYMLDPVNIATVGIAAPVTVGKSMTTLSRAMLTARNAALIEGATELGIQTFVYAHKQDIDSPYTSADALANIGMAATGAAALGGVVGGLGGWLDRVVKFADELPPSKDVEFAKESIKRLQATVKSAPKADTPEEQIQSDIDFLTEMEARATEYAKPSKTADQYEIPEPRKATTQQTVTERERDILARQGIADNYHAELEEFNALENKILEIDGEQIDAGDLMKSFDDELEGLESVLTCVYKGAA